MKKSVKAAICGLCTALCVVLMFMGGTIYVFAYAVPMVLGILMVMIKKTLGNAAAVSVYISTSLLSMILVSEKESVLMYLLFFGYYPIIKHSIEKIKPKILSVLLKFVVFNASLILIEFICVYVFKIPFFENNKFSIIVIAAFAVSMNIMFIMYEFLLKYYLIIYEKKLEKRIKNIFK